ncbi:MAG: patatin-like phospholipase family protein [Bacteroidetes bacterium]|nr:patatin-like phospholipase family protein [Bacteroidota bacterium]
MFRRKAREFVLALGGGGARGLAHIGVLKILQQEGIKVKAIAGTSMGAVVGAMFAYYNDAIEVEEIFRKFLSSKFHENFGRTFFLLSENPDTFLEPNKTMRRLGRGYVYLKAASSSAVFSRDILNDTLKCLLPDLHFSDLKLPFLCVATDLVTGKEVVLRRGKVIPALIASSSIPGIVEPMRIGPSLLVDGSTTSTVPVTAAIAAFPGRVIAVDVSMDLKRDSKPESAFEVAVRAGEITNYYHTQMLLSQSDFLIRPAVGRTNWANFDRLDEMIRAGETAARKSVLRLIS